MGIIFIVLVLLVPLANPFRFKNVKENGFYSLGDFNIWNPLININDSNIDLNTASNEVSEPCKSINLEFEKGLFSTGWALSMIDSWGKIPIGMAEGNFVNLGNYDECLAIKKYIKSLSLTMETQYCLGDFNVISTDDPIIDSLLQGMIGICMPKVCTPKDIENQIQIWIKSVNLNLKTKFQLNITVNNCQTSDQNLITTPDIIAVVILALLGVFSIVSTIYDLRVELEERQHLLRAFSWYTNSLEILGTRINPYTISALHGIRSLSLCWVVFAHYIYIYLTLPNTNRLTSFADLYKWKTLTLGGANYSVDSFLLIGGCQVSYAVLQSLKQSPKMFDLFKFYFNRYLRKTPAFAMLTLIDAGLLLHFSNGPLYPQFVNMEVEGCRQSWWHNLLYINNYVSDLPCLEHGWYFAVEMHLFILSPILLYIFWKKPLLGYIVSGCLLFISFVFIFTNTYLYSLNDSFMEIMSKEVVEVYITTHTRFAPYVIGIALGYLILHAQEKKWRLKKINLFIFWLTDIILLIGLMVANQSFFNILNPPTVIERAFFKALHRTVWSFALSWIIYVCALGQGGFINSFLSWKVFIPISKISYCIYLIYVDVIYVFIVSMRSVPGYSEFIKIPNTVINIMLTLFFGFIFSILFEVPLMNIEYYIFQVKRKLIEVKQKTEDNEFKSSPK